MPLKHFDVTVTNKIDLDNNYLPFIKNGGLFIATNESCQLRELVQVILRLFDHAEPITWQSKINFINPPFANSRFPTGIGVALTEEVGEIVRSKM